MGRIARCGHPGRDRNWGPMTPTNESLPSRWLVYASPLLLVAIVLFSMVLFDRTEATSNEVRRIDRVRLNTVRALSGLQDAETGQRGYLLTGNEAYLAPYVEGKDSVHGRMAELRRLTRDEPVQQAYIEQLLPIIDRRVALLDSAIVARRAGDLPGAVSIVSSGRGLVLMDSARRLFGLMRREEGRMLAQGEDRERKDRDRLQIALIIGLVISAGVSFFVSNKLMNDATRHWLMTAELQSRVEMLRSQTAARSPSDPLKKTTPTSSKSVS